jgi:hypothetical protein
MQGYPDEEERPARQLLPYLASFQGALVDNTPCLRQWLRFTSLCTCMRPGPAASLVGNVNFVVFSRCRSRFSRLREAIVDHSPRRTL